MSNGGQAVARWIVTRRLMLSAGLCLHLLASAVAVRAEQLVAFGDLPERWRSVAVAAFADADDPVGRSADAIKAAEFDLD